jgi:drug/metabolite transporter (DMT)-like permease
VRTQDILALLTLAALWGGSFLFMRMAAPEFGPVSLIGVRVSIAAAFLLPLLLASGKASALLQNAGPLLLVGVFNSALPFCLFAFATLSLTAGLTAVINAAVPMFTAVVGVLWLREKLAGVALLGLLVGLGGVARRGWDKMTFTTDGLGWGVLAGLLGSLSYALAANYTKVSLTGLGSLELATGSQVSASLVLAIPCIWLWPQEPVSLRAWLAVITMGIASTGVAYILFFRLIASLGPSRAVTVTYLVPVFGMMFGAIFLAEAITTDMVLGCGLILFGTALATGMIHPLR